IRIHLPTQIRKSFIASANFTTLVSLSNRRATNGFRSFSIPTRSVSPRIFLLRNQCRRSPRTSSPKKANFSLHFAETLAQFVHPPALPVRLVTFRNKAFRVCLPHVVRRNTVCITPLLIRMGCCFPVRRIDVEQ